MEVRRLTVIGTGGDIGKGLDGKVRQANLSLYGSAETKRPMRNLLLLASGSLPGMCRKLVTRRIR